MLTAHFIKEWDEGIESFAKSPPNATISVFSEEGDTLPGLFGPFPPVASRPMRKGLLWPKSGCELMASRVPGRAVGAPGGTGAA